MMISDDLWGAFALSFILSFVFIGGVGAVLYMFPYLNKLGEVNEEDHY